MGSQMVGGRCGLMAGLPSWDQVKSVWEIVATVLAILAFLLVIWRTLRRGWRYTFGARRSQSRVLDRLACGEPIERVNSWLGVPVFSNGDSHTYELPGAWVHISESDGVVDSFAITITSRRFHYRTPTLTFGLYDVKLGKSTFGDLDLEGQSGRTWSGAHRYGADVRLWGGNPGMYQDYWFAHNDAGCGKAPARDEPRIAPVVTINTMRVGIPYISQERLAEFESELVVGVEYDSIRLRLARRYDRPLYRFRRWAAERIDRWRGRQSLERG